MGQDRDCLSRSQAFIAAGDYHITALQVTVDFYQLSGANARSYGNLPCSLVFIHYEHRNTFGPEHQRITWHRQSLPGS